MTQASRQSAERGQALYDAQIRAQVEGEHHGKFLILDVNTGDYEIDAEDLAACHRLLERRPNAVLFGVRVGHRAAYRLGLRSVSLKG